MKYNIEMVNLLNDFENAVREHEKSKSKGYEAEHMMQLSAKIIGYKIKVLEYILRDEELSRLVVNFDSEREPVIALRNFTVRARHLIFGRMAEIKDDMPETKKEIFMVIQSLQNLKDTIEKESEDKKK